MTTLFKIQEVHSGLHSLLDFILILLILKILSDLCFADSLHSRASFSELVHTSHGVKMPTSRHLKIYMWLIWMLSRLGSSKLSCMCVIPCSTIATKDLRKQHGNSEPVAISLTRTICSHQKLRMSTLIFGFKMIGLAFVYEVTSQETGDLWFLKLLFNSMQIRICSRLCANLEAQQRNVSEGRKRDAGGTCVDHVFYLKHIRRILCIIYLA